MTQATVSFASHRQAEFDLVTDLKRLGTVAAGLGRDDLVKLIKETRSRIEEHRFSIAVVGEFKRGKSTFINALLGREILPSDILPTSATINRVTYALKPTVRIRFKDATQKDIDIEQLADYVTKLTPEAEAMASTIDEAVVCYPVPFCKNNVDIIDTPGLSDDDAMTEVTLGILPRVDAAILVILATAPFSQSEAAFLESLLIEYGLGSVIFVVTALDRLRRPEDRERILTTVTDRIRDRIRQHAADHFGAGTDEAESYLRRVGEPRVFGVSGYDALIGKTEHDEDLLAASRFPGFEEFLERFLTEESGLVALRTHTERLVSITTEVERHLSTTAYAPPQADSGPDALDALLHSLEWLAQAERRRLDEVRRGAQDQVRPHLEGLVHALREAADLTLADLTVTPDDLEDGRLSAFVSTHQARLTEALNGASACVARAVFTELRRQCGSGVSGLLQVAVAFDRVAAHLRSAQASPFPPSASPPEETLVEGLGGDHGFDREAAVEAALRVTFDVDAQERLSAVTHLLSLPAQWAAAVDVRPMPSTGPKFARKAVDLVRTEKFKSDLRGRWIEEVERQAEQSRSPREQAMNEQVTASFAVIERQLDEILEEIRRRRSQLQANRHSRIALAEQERRRLEQIRLEVEAIRKRSQDLARQLNA